MSNDMKIPETDSRRTLLIVDDSALERVMLSGLLQSDYEILAAADGEEALALLEERRGDVAAIVLDIVMPGMDGYAVMKRLHGSAAFAHIPIVVSTGLEDDETREKAIACGANGFVTKPYNRTLLMHAVQNAVRLRDAGILAERAKAERQQRELLDNLPTGAALYTYDGERIRVVHINKSYWRLVGREPRDYSELSIFDAIHPEDRDVILRELRSAIRQGRNVEVDVRVLCGCGGAYKPFHVSASVRGERGGTYALFASYMPISDEAMSMQQMLPIALATMMSCSDDYSYVMDRDFHYVCCSRSAAELLGLESERDIFGKTDLELFGGELGRTFAERNRQVAATGEPVINRIQEIPRREGGVVYVSTSIYPIKDSAGRVIGQYGICHDVTRERMLDFELDTLLNTIPSGVLKYAADESEQFAYINRNFVEGLGYTQKSFREKFHNCFREMLWHEDRDWAEAEIIRQEGGGGIGRFDYRVEAADGELRWIHDEGIKVTDRDGKAWYYVSLFDITESHEAQEKLRVSEEINRLAMEHSGKIVTRFDVRARTLTMPESLTPIFEVPQILEGLPEEPIARGRVSPETADAYRELFEGIVAGRAAGTATYQQFSTLGWRWLEAHYTTVFSNAGQPISAVITFEDITERLEKELVYSKWQQSLTKRPEASYTLFRCNLSKNASFDSCEGTLLGARFLDDSKSLNGLTAAYVRQVFEEDRERYLAFVNSDAMLAGYYRGHRADSLEYRESGADGSVRWRQLSVELVEYPNSRDVEAYLLYEDINESKLAELQTKEMAETDPLTGVLNRTTFAARMEQLAASSRNGERHALLMVDVDDFKRVNDLFGHAAGDRVLRELTRQIQSKLRHDDLLGRLGGDEFLVFLKNIASADCAAAKAKQICELTLTVEPSGTPVSVSAGVAMTAEGECSFEALYRRVDAALYQKKADGKNGFRFAEE